MSDELETILNGEETGTPEPEPEPTEDIESEEVEAEDAAKAEPEEAKGEEPEPDEAKDKDESPSSGDWSEAAMLAERRNRQAKEAELRAEINTLREQLKGRPERPDVLEDPDGAFKHTEENLRGEFDKKFVQMSEEMVKAQYEDYDDVLAVVEEEAASNPAISGEIRRSGHPALTAYRLGKKLIGMKEIGDPGVYRERIRNELREELKAEMLADREKSEAEKKAQADSQPKDLSGERSVAGRSGAEFSGATPLEEVIG